MLRSVSKSCNYVADSMAHNTKKIASGVLVFLPYLIGATICLGLREQTLIVPQETLIFVNRKILEGATAILCTLALKTLWDVHESYNSGLDSRKIEMITLAKTEYDTMKVAIRQVKEKDQEIKRLKNELRETNVMFNPNFEEPGNRDKMAEISRERKKVV